MKSKGALQNNLYTFSSVDAPQRAVILNNRKDYLRTSPKYIADTTVLVDYLRNNESVRGFLERERPAISSVGRAELIHGSQDKLGLREAMALCDRLEELSFTEASTKNALRLLEKYHLSHGLFFLDALIASTTLEHNLTLVTHNIKHFSFIPSLKIRAWSEFV